jgi:acyl-coenzyme A synthetase/AMP-(fatty) acid ligase
MRMGKKVVLQERGQAAQVIAGKHVKSLWFIHDKTVAPYAFAGLRAGIDIDFDAVLKKQSDAFTSVPCHIGDTTHILFSSGTTGEPKVMM